MLQNITRMINGNIHNLLLIGIRLKLSYDISWGTMKMQSAIERGKATSDTGLTKWLVLFLLSVKSKIHLASL